MFQDYDEIFRQRADAYQAAMEKFPRARDAEFRVALERVALSPGITVCDVPAGGGYLRRFLPPDVHYVAVENAADFVSHCPSGERDRVVISPMHPLALESGSADVLFSIAAVHHQRDKPAFYREAARVLQPGGRFVLADVERGSRVDRFLNGFLDRANSMGHEGVFLDPASAQAVADCGFEIEFDRVVHYPWSFESESDMGRFAQWLFGMDRVTVPEVIAAIDEILGRCDGPGKVNLQWGLRVICGRRLERGGL